MAACWTFKFKFRSGSWNFKTDIPSLSLDCGGGGGGGQGRSSILSIFFSLNIYTVYVWDTFVRLLPKIKKFFFKIIISSWMDSRRARCPKLRYLCFFGRLALVVIVVVVVVKTVDTKLGDSLINLICFSVSRYYCIWNIFQLMYLVINFIYNDHDDDQSI